MHSVWIPFLMLSISNCDMLTGLGRNSRTLQHALDSSSKRFSNVEREDLNCGNFAYRNIDPQSTQLLNLRGGGSNVVGCLKDFQQKASLLLRSVGGTMNSSAFVKRWGEVFLGDDLERSGCTILERRPSF